MQLSRRDFLGSSAALMLPLLRPQGASAATTGDQPAMKLGLVTYQWGKDWDLPTLIENCAASGFAGVELRTTHNHGVEISLNEHQRAEVKKRFDDSPVEFVGPGSACDYHSADPDELKSHIEETKQFIILSHDCGGTGVKVRPNGLPKTVPIEKTIEQIGRSLREVAEFADGYGQEIRLEVHGSRTSALPLIHQMMQIADHPQARICWNCNSTDFDGDGLQANFDLVAGKIATVHIHDLRNNDSYPWPEFFPMLKAIEFSGWTLLEDGQVPDDIVSAMRENRTRWEQLVR